MNDIFSFNKYKRNHVFHFFPLAVSYTKNLAIVEKNPFARLKGLQSDSLSRLVRLSEPLVRVV